MKKIILFNFILLLSISGSFAQKNRVSANLEIHSGDIPVNLKTHGGDFTGSYYYSILNKDKTYEDTIMWLGSTFELKGLNSKSDSLLILGSKYYKPLSKNNSIDSIAKGEPIEIFMAPKTQLQDYLPGVWGMRHYKSKEAKAISKVLLYASSAAVILGSAFHFANKGSATNAETFNEYRGKASNTLRYGRIMRTGLAITGLHVGFVFVLSRVNKTRIIKPKNNNKDKNTLLSKN